MLSAGIVGGLGPETSSKLALELNRRVIAQTQRQPDIVLVNVPVSKETELAFIRGQSQGNMKDLLVDAVGRLNQTGVDFIIVPCNTVHVLIDEMRNASSVPVLSIIEETVAVCKQKNVSQVGILGSSSTIKTKLYQQGLEQESITVISPSAALQSIVDEAIKEILHGDANKAKQQLIQVASELISKGAELVVLGCTDLGIALKDGDCEVPLVDSLEVLSQSTVKRLAEM